jgi:C_GCAxxG_C_C family probable redox protein
VNTPHALKVAADHGFDYEARHRSCGQCVVASIQDALEIRNDVVFRCASSLGGGIGKMCDGACGAYSGGALMIGFVWGRTRDRFDGDKESKRICDLLTVDLHNRFIAEFHSVICREIHDRLFGRRFDLWSEEDGKVFDEAGAHRDKCTRVVALSASWTTELVLGQLARQGIGLDGVRALAPAET